MKKIKPIETGGSIAVYHVEDIQKLEKLQRETLKLLEEHPILFKGDMVRAILEDRKTETRRIIKPEPDYVNKISYPRLEADGWYFTTEQPEGLYLGNGPYKCPYGQVGDRLWVRENHTFLEYSEGYDNGVTQSGSHDFCLGGAILKYYDGEEKTADELYEEDFIRSPKIGKLRPSIFMPRWASRITLEITEIKVERVQDITHGGCVNEGLTRDWDGSHHWYLFPKGHKELNSASQNPKYAFRLLWDSINEKRGFPWESNPWVWVIKFKRVEQC